MTVASELEAVSARASDRFKGQRAERWLLRAAVVVGALALLAAAAPMLLAGLVIAVTRPGALIDGDQAIDEMALIRSAHFEQLVGNYSRFGWNHPGPSWFYAMDPVYLGLGGHSWSFYVAFLSFHAVVAGLIVALAWRRGGVLLALLTSGLVLLYVRTMGEALFRVLWPPFVPILPIALFFVLAAAGAAGSTPAMVGALIAGSFAVQTHVSTGAVVLCALVIMVAIRLLAARFGRAPAEPRERSYLTVPLTVGGLLILVLMWVPVAIDEITGGPGNLTKLWWFFSAQHGRHGYREALSVFGRMLEVYPFGRLPYLLETNFSSIPPERMYTIVAFGAAAALLVLLATLLRDRFAQAVGVLMLVAVPVTVVSISRIVGPAHPYIVVWVTTYPLILVVGWAALLARARPWTRWRGAVAPFVLRGVALGLAVVVVALAQARFEAFQQLPSPATEQYDPDTRAAWGMVDAALAGQPPQPLLVNITADDRIPLAAGVALPLYKRGWTIRVNKEWVYIFGDSSRPTGTERLELVLVDPRDVDRATRQMPDLQPIGHTKDTYLFLRHHAGG